MKLDYNIFAAIELRTNQTTYLTDKYGNHADIDFKMSIQLARDEMFMFGWDFPAESNYILDQDAFKNRTVTKSEWKRWSQSYRKFLYDMSQEDRTPYEAAL